MIAFRVLDVKNCMNHMLVQNTFDKFQLAEAHIVTKASLVIDGHLTPDYLSEEEMRQEGYDEARCASYESLRPICLDMIKGKRTPAAFRFSFLLPRAYIRQLVERSGAKMREDEVANLTFNVNFAKGELMVTTSCSMRSFTMDKTLEHLWDEWLFSFFKDRKITVEKVA